MDKPKAMGLLTSSRHSYFVKRVLTGVRSTLQGSGFELRLFETHGLRDEEYHRFIARISRQEDLCGIVYTHLRLNTQQLLRFKARGIAVAAVAERAEGVDWVTVDEVQGAYLATRHLLGLGHTRIGLLGGPDLAFQARNREEGYLRALKEAGIAPSRGRDACILNFSEDEGRDAMNMMLDLPRPPTAVFVAAGDLTALGALKALRDRGLRVPESMSLVGFDNLDFCTAIYPKLSTVNQPLEAMGAWAAGRLLEAGRKGPGGPCRGEILEPELIVRESAQRSFPLPERSSHELAQ